MSRKHRTTLDGRKHSTLLASASRERLMLTLLVGGREARRSALRQLRALEKLEVAR